MGVKSEHCIGILKNCVPTFKRISAIIKGPKSIRRVLQQISCAVILHNMLLETNKPIPSEWMEMKEIEEQHEWTADYDTSYIPTTNGDEVVYDRRQQLFDALIKENYIT